MLCSAPGAGRSGPTPFADGPRGSPQRDGAGCGSARTTRCPRVASPRAPFQRSSRPVTVRHHCPACPVRAECLQYLSPSGPAGLDRDATRVPRWAWARSPGSPRGRVIAGTPAPARGGEPRECGERRVCSWSGLGAVRGRGSPGGSRVRTSAARRCRHAGDIRWFAGRCNVCPRSQEQRHGADHPLPRFGTHRTQPVIPLAFSLWRRRMGLLPRIPETRPLHPLWSSRSRPPTPCLSQVPDRC